MLQAADPISRDESHYWRMWLALAGVAFVLWRYLVDRAGRTQVGEAVYRGALVITVTLSVGVYYQFDREVLLDFEDYTDPTYYYLNSKYLDELGYFALYPAMLVADRDHRNRHASHIKSYRDLHTDEVRPTDQAFAEGERVRDERFTPERWDAFTHDVDFFLSKFEREMLQSNFFVDHGYNPPPTWSIVGGTLASITPVEHLKAICVVDIALVALTFAVVAWAFGFEPMLFAVLFFCCTFSGRWPILGQAILRFDWVCALTVGLCMLKLGWHGTAGGMVVYAGLNRVFPLVFLAPWAFAAARDTAREGRPPGRHLAFAGGGILVGLALGGGALGAYGPGILADSARNLAMHNESYSSHRVGLGSVLVYRGETTRAQINANGGIGLKEQRVRALQPWLKLTGLVAAGWILITVWRSGREDWELLPLAILPLFCVTNAQINYYNLRMVLILWHAWHSDSRFHRVALAGLFAVEIATQATKVVELDRYTTTTTASYGMLAYLALLVAWMAVDATAPARGRDGRRGQ